jgi:hypothetical protein
MNKKPVWYLQTDPRWKDKRYPCSNGSGKMSIGGGGCGPTSAAMLIDTLTGKQCLPTETMEWACSHGYITAGQGTEYSYFKPQFEKYGLKCDMLTWDKCFSVGSWVKYKVEEMLKEGYYFIALMKEGLWTKGGHYIVVWWSDNKVRINDPASTRDERNNGDPHLFWTTAKYFWWVDAREFNKPNPKEDKIHMDMTDQELKDFIKCTIKEIGLGEKPSDWAVNQGVIEKAQELNISDGSNPKSLATREQVMAMIERGLDSIGGKDEPK